MSDKTAPQRVARYEQAMRERGMVKVHVWVPKDRADELRVTAAQMRGDASNPTDAS